MSNGFSDTPIDAAAGDILPERDLIPLLPRGVPVFEDIPVRAVVIDALAPAIGDGTMVIRGEGGVGVVLVREGRLLEVLVFDEETRRDGQELLTEMRAWADANVSAYRLDRPLIGLSSSILRGETLYEDLRLSWTNWRSLLADLATREGSFVVELTTPAGRGVTCFANGRQVASYTDSHPALGEPSLLDTLAASGTGNVWVRHQRAAPIDFDPSAVSTPLSRVHTATAARPSTAPVRAARPQPAEPMFARAVETTPAPEAQPVEPDPQHPTPTTQQRPSQPAPAHSSEPAPAPRHDTPTSGPSTMSQDWDTPIRDFAGEHDAAPPAAEHRSASSVDGPAVGISAEVDAHHDPMSATSWTPPWEVPYSNWSTPEEAPPTSLAEEPDRPRRITVTISDVLPDLRSIAQRRLQLSAPRVEAILDDAAVERRPLDAVLAEIRTMTIRGVMQATVESMVDEMLEAAEQLSA